MSETENLRRIVSEEIGKALRLPAGAVARPLDAASVSASYVPSYLQQLAFRGGGSGWGTLPRAPLNDVAFGPGEPLFPAPVDPPLSSGRPAPRLREYPVSWNLQTTTTRSVPWTVLRDAADQVSIMRSCIEVCKSAITGLEWGFTIDSVKARRLAKRSGVSDQSVESDLRDRYADDIDHLYGWWSKPDRINNWTFSEWLGALLEDQLVLDAVSLYPHLTLGGDLHSLELVDSTTIKPLLDYRGAIPQPPYPAYQQLLWGFARGEFSQEPTDKVDHEFVSAIYGRPVGDVEAKTDTLLYKVRHRRTRSPYGFSNVEHALVDVDLWLKRWEWLRAEYSAGVTPEMIVQVDANMTPEQLRQYEAVFNDDLSGRSEERHRARFLPAGFLPSYPGGLEAKFNSDFDLHLIRLICAAFDVLPTSLGFTPNHGMGGMGGTGHTQAEQDKELQRATKPTAQWVVDLVNEVCTLYLGMPPEVTFKFFGLDEEDEQQEAQLLTGYVNGGLQTLNEGRDQLNLPRYDFPEADQPMVVTPTGPVWLNVDVQPTSMPGNLPNAPQNQVGGVNQPALPAAPDSDAGDASRRSDDRGRSTGGIPEQRAERKAFLSFAQRRQGKEWREFQFKHHSPDVADAANRLASAGDVDACKALFEYHDDAAA